MDMTGYRPAQIYASINTKSELPKRVNEKSNKDEKTKYLQGNEIQVSSNGEISLQPDKCKLMITVHSKKETAQDAKNSVSRRLEYILQTLNNYQVKESDISTSKLLQRMDGQYQLDAEIIVTFVDFKKCQTVSNFLVEKLDENVKINLPEFYQSPQRLENLRRQAGLLAVKNAKQKAAEIAKFLHGTAGKVLAIREENTSEWEGPSDLSLEPELPASVQQRISLATVHVSTKITVTFELRTKGKQKDPKQ